MVLVCALPKYPWVRYQPVPWPDLCFYAWKEKWKTRFLTWHHEVSHKSSIHFEARLIILWSQKSMQPLARRGRPNTSIENRSFLHNTPASREQTTSPFSPPDLFIWSRIPLKIASFSPHVECSSPARSYSPGIYDPQIWRLLGAPLSCCNYRNIWLIILDAICGTYG